MFDFPFKAKSYLDCGKEVKINDISSDNSSVEHQKGVNDV